MSISKSLLLFVLLARMAALPAQEQHKIDSLRTRLSQQSTDSARSYTCDDLALKYSDINTDSAIYFGNKALELAEKAGSPKFQVNAMISLGIIYRHRGEYNTSLAILHKGLELATSKNLPPLYFRRLYSSLNLSYTEQGNYTVGIEYGFKSLHEIEKTHDTMAMAQANNNLANTYFEIGQYDKALKYYRIALGYAEQLKELYGQSLLTGNIGSVYFQQQKYDSAKVFYDRSLQLCIEVDDISGQAIALGNIGSYYDEKHDDAKAIQYFNKAAAIFEQIRMMPNVADMSYHLSCSWRKQKDYQKAIFYGQKALSIAEADSSYPEKEQAHLALHDVYQQIKNYPLAYEHYKEYIAARDSTFNEKNKKEQFKTELLYEYGRKRYADSLDALTATRLQQQELLREKEKTGVQRKLTATAATGFLLMLILAAFIFRSYSQKKKSNAIISAQKEKVEKQNTEIEFQKIILETRNREVTDSINYAKRLQDAILPPRQLIYSEFPESFILYRPKDIVAGDFYFFEKQNGRIILAAADSTGHGVPGALVSVVCSNALARCVKEFGITDPAKILDRTRELVLETFSRSESSVKDGMDIALISMLKNQDGTYTVDFAGANNPLWIISGNEFSEIKGEKQAIGDSDDMSPFTATSIHLQKGDCLYLFSDGYADQFGGEKGKKFKLSNLRKVLLENSALPMNEQLQVVTNALREWQQNMDQVDDILVMGLRLS